MASNGTSLSSCEQNRRVSIGAPSFSWSWRKCTPWSRTALTSETGTFTSPKLIEPVQIERATSGRLLAEARLERGHQHVGVHVRRVVVGQLDLLALRLPRDQLLDAGAVGVLVLLRLEPRLERRHERARHVHLALRRLLLRARHLHVLARCHLVGEAHRV